ncbi:MAG: lamin tail domain-containing protein [bacterium]|nr:lamin tail domain-containing protein [bacterium]
MPFGVYAYSDTTTHPALTQKTAEAFNKKWQNIQLSDEDITLLMDGAIDEDISARYMQHFYDPIHNTGLSFLSIANKFKPWPAATIWSVNTALQASKDSGANKNDLYFGADTDHTWNRAVYEYVYGGKNRAMSSLGHLLHLVQDMSVPPHTRDDPHPPVGKLGSIYEEYTSQFDTETIGDIDYVPINESFKYFVALLDSLARKTNANFYSKDTTPDKSSRFHAITGVKLVTTEVDGEYITFEKQSVNSDEYYLDMINISRDHSTGKLIKQYSLDDPSDLVMQDYWRLLSQSAVSYGVAAIELFFKDVEIEKQTGELYSLQYPTKKGDNVTRLASISSPFLTSNSSNNPQFIGPVSNTVAQNNPEVITAVLGSANIVEVNKASLESVKQIIPPLITDSISEISVRESILLPVVDSNAPAPPPLDSASPLFLFAIPSGAQGSGGEYQPPPAPVKIAEEIIVEETSTPDVPAMNSAEEVIVEATSTPDTQVADIDTDPPDLSAFVAECADSYTIETCLVATSSISIVFESTADDFSYFSLSIDSVSSTSTATSTSYNFATSTSVSISAVDSSGNQSAPFQQQIEYSAIPVVISEVAWSGANGFEDGEWIELRNTTNHDIPLDDWILYSATDMSPYIPLAGTIPANGFYLIEHQTASATDELLESPITSLPASQWLSFGAGLDNSGEQLVLARASTTVDTTPAISECRGWCGGSRLGDMSMERADLAGSGLNASVWQSYTYVYTYATTTNGQAIFGTPGQRNTNEYLLPSTANDVTLKKANSPYITKTNWGIPPGTTVTIEPGVVIKLLSSSAQISIVGTLIAQGTSDEPIIFTSIYDDEYGGDIHHDGSGQPPKAGDWRMLSFYPGSDASVIDNVLVRYGGHKIYGSGVIQSGILASGASPTLRNVTVQYSQRSGVYLSDSSSTITNLTVRDSGSSGADIALYVLRGSPILENIVLDSNWTGGYLSRTSAQVSGGEIINNSFALNIVNPVFPWFVENISGYNNNENSIRISHLSTGTTTYRSNDLPYYFYNTFTVASSTALVFENGSKLAFGSNPMTIDGGYLSLSGALVSDADYDVFVGDVDNNGSSTITIGRNSGFVFKNNAQTHIENTSFAYLKKALSYGETSPIDLSSVTFSNNTTAIEVPEIATSTRIENIIFENNTTDTTNPLPD